MRWQEKQDKIEAEVYEAMDELAEILSIDIPFYPEVIWLGREFKPKIFPKNLREELEERWRSGRSSYLVDQKTVVICRRFIQHSILEESAHALNFICSGLSYAGHNKKEEILWRILVEMVGFLGARILDSNLENPYLGFPDLARLTKEAQEKAKEIIEEKIGGSFDFYNFFIYQQGYVLGDLIYFEYLSGNVSKAQLRRLFLDKIDDPDVAKAKFSRLKRRFWPVTLNEH